MASFNSPNTGAKLVASVIANPNPNSKQYIMRPVAGMAAQKNIHTPASRKDSKK